MSHQHHGSSLEGSSENSSIYIRVLKNKKNVIKGLENEPLEKQIKYQSKFNPGDKEEISFTGIFRYVEVDGKVDKNGDPVYKRKRVFRKMKKVKKYLTAEQREEIDQAFHLFD